MIGARAFPADMRPLALRLLRNLKWVLLSHGAIAVLGMGSLALAAHALGAAGLGVLALVEAYARIVARLVHLESWQAVIAHGSTALEAGETDRFGRLIGLSLGIDVTGGLLAALAALALVPLAVPALGLAADSRAYLFLAPLMVVVSLRSTGIALLRLFDRFDILAVIDSGTAALRFGLSALVLAAGGGIAGFLWVLIAVSLIDGLAAPWAGLAEMRRRGYRPIPGGIRATLALNPGFLRLMWNSNLSVMLRESTRRLDMILLATLLPVRDIGFYHVARRVGEAVVRLGRPLSQTLYPELTRLVAQGELAQVRRMTIGVSGGIAAVLVVVLLPVLVQLDDLLTLAFGTDFTAAESVVRVQTVAVGLSVAGVILTPALLSLGRDRALVWIGGVAAASFFLLLVPAVWVGGVTGAALARLASNALWLGLCVLVLRQALREAGTPAGNLARGGAVR